MKKGKLEELQRMTEYCLKICDKENLQEISRLYSEVLSRLLELKPK